MRKYRNLTAVKAWFRNSAGAMKNRSEKRQSNNKDHLEEWGIDLPEDAKRILYENLWDLYDTDDEEGAWRVIHLKDIKT